MENRVSDFLYEEESYVIRGAAFEIYKKFRNTQKERVYLNALNEELQLRGLSAEVEKRIPIYYGAKKVGTYVPDIVVNNAIILELKAKPFFHRQDREQFWHYLKNSSFKLGFLINFGTPRGVDIIRRVYDLQRSSA